MIKRLSFNFTDVFFAFIIVELFIGGSGRVFTYHNITLRMLLYGAALIWFFITAIKTRQVNRFELVCASIFVLSTVLSTCLGILHEANPKFILLDIKPLLFFLSIFYFGKYINSLERIRRIIQLLKFSSLFMAVSYLIVLLLLKTNIIGFDPLYNYLSRPEFYLEFMFRGVNGFYFYKGFFFLNIGFFCFLIDDSNKYNKLFATIIFMAIFLTLLRWSLVTVLFILLLYITFDYYKHKKLNIPLLAYLVGAILFILIFKDWYLEMLGNKVISDQIRETQSKQFMSSLTGAILTLLMGKGFGIGIPSRPIHMEYMYMEIFYKQGLLGMAFWLTLFGFIANYFRKLFLPNATKGESNSLSSNDHKQMVVPMFLAVLVVYMQSVTNPFLINSIGMSITLMALLSLRFIYINKDVA